MERDNNSGRGVRLGRGGKIGAGVVGVVLVGLLLLEWTVLRGERIAHLTVGLGATDAERILIDRVGEEHLVEVDTRARRNGATEGRAVVVRLVDPNGEVVYESAGWVARKERSFAFTPRVAGSYRLSVRPDGVLGGSSSGFVRASVFVGDRRLLPRLTAALPF